MPENLTGWEVDSSYLPFENLWLPAYDRANMTVDDVIEELNTTTPVIKQFEEWFEVFFGVDGVVT